MEVGRDRAQGCPVNLARVLVGFLESVADKAVAVQTYQANRIAVGEAEAGDILVMAALDIAS